MVSPKNINWWTKFCNINHKENTPPSIVGFFQLYKKKVFHQLNLKNAASGDYFFGYDNFKLFSCLDNLFVLHLGAHNKNWNGKVEEFIDDVNISIKNIYYKCFKNVNNVTYNEKQQLVKYGNSANIYDDTWTCSHQMRFDIYNFFKNDGAFKIAEIGAHKGYSTKILANIFKMVYAVDNNLEWTEFSKKLNKNSKNIEYIFLDIYKENWDVLPDDIDVAFIDAMHTYDACKSDTMKSLKKFKTLKYIIFDDYGVWAGVKKTVDELILDNTLRFERFIGLTDVPWSKGVVQNVNEGIICSVNRNMPTPMPTPTPTPLPTIVVHTPQQGINTRPVEAIPTTSVEQQLESRRESLSRSKAKPKPKYPSPTPQPTPTPTIPIFKVINTSQNVKNVKKNNFAPSLLAWNQYSQNYSS